MKTEISDVLENADLNCVIESNAAVTEEKAEIIPDILVLDVKMKCMDCLELYKRIHTFMPNTVVLMITIQVIEELIQTVLVQRPFQICHASQGQDTLKDILSNGELKDGSLLLLVDENPGSAVYLDTILSTIGRHVTIVHSCEDVVTLVQKLTNRMFSV